MAEIKGKITKGLLKKSDTLPYGIWSIRYRCKHCNKMSELEDWETDFDWDVWKDSKEQILLLEHQCSDIESYITSVIVEGKYQGPFRGRGKRK